MMRHLLILLAFIFVAYSQEGFSKNNVERYIENINTTIKNPLELRDPFKRMSFRSNELKGTRKKVQDEQNFIDLQNISLEQIKVVGILFGGKRSAIIKTTNDEGKVSPETALLKEGMKVGLDDAEVKAILPGGIVLVEKIINVYDQEEYLETMIPLSTE